ncbi:hypothetical protein HUA74_20100 [Myxococcus sp. CA051A]|uniref:Lipoprotein n=1 Tax=Myxococcus llanfairpwllgwyngyllgogerychwyrndrobwllllantysiliogogogochensis TaxID=2590453 RepID=A0A540X021_9BACT|nr:MULTISPECIES: hypothetical protein [Myxococcus]NTX16292.1 hypothetical protein [Myxococcus sp. CA056]NTX40208.1 hypothetical protein [Myxococcus sp. CA033]NTX55033.1 hypothetical protein [Myxococcus sp. CA039A]NTX62956.1 hypothetical protein [Myxococcus sp. CA051A]TQF14592.1 hypothetical protein FJV41_17880 [Myxococcus llanfairpwllgwyngyllgogerychwyrndrobwllllantysiliogogogochensis]
MKTPFIRFLTALPLAAALGCDSAATVVEPVDPQTQVASATTVGFVFDSTRIATPPTGGIPTDLLPRTAFNDAVLQGALVGSTEAFTTTGTLGSRRDLESRTWTLENDPSEGQVLVLNRLGSGPAVPQEPAVMQRTAIARLQRWGIPASEIGAVYQVKSFLETEEDGVAAVPELHRYKTFVMRAINGIRVEGHRAVVSHGVDGTFQRALISWPPLARVGHLLRTRLSTADIEQRAREALLAEGETAGPVRLFWKYVPTQLSTGEWALTLQVGAAMEALTGTTHTEESRVVDVDVSPVQ